MFLVFSSEALKAFSRNEISKSIETLQTKWQQDEKSNAKRAAATTPAKTVNVAPASLDDITEVPQCLLLVYNLHSILFILKNDFCDFSQLILQSKWGTSVLDKFSD